MARHVAAGPHLADVGHAAVDQAMGRAAGGGQQRPQLLVGRPEVGELERVELAAGGKGTVGAVGDPVEAGLARREVGRHAAGALVGHRQLDHLA